MKYVRKIVIVLTACLITLVFVELIYSTMHMNVYREEPSSAEGVWPWIIYDPLMGWMNKPMYIMPGHFQIDENGFRIIESSPTPDKKKRLIVCMGDSGTFGIWVARQDPVFGGFEFDSFPSYLQDIISKNNDMVINAGTIGYTSAHLLRQYMSSIRRLKPQIIVIRIGHNDHLWSWDKRLDAQQPRNVILRYLYNTFPATLTVQTIARYIFLFRQKSISEPWSTPDQYEYNLQTLITTANNDGVKVFLIDYPLRPLGIPPASEANYLKQLKSKFRLKSHAAYIEIHEKYMQRLETVAKSTGTQIIRTGHRLEDPKEKAFSGWDQVHPNKRGMRIIAEEIAKVLNKDAGNQ